MTHTFTPEELDTLSAQVDEQLFELTGNATRGMEKGGEQLFGDASPADDLPSKQRQDIENNTHENANTFLQTLAGKAKTIICDAESDLQKQYELFGKVDKVTLLERLAALLAVMGFAGIGLKILTVAITVYILHIGLKSFTDKYCKK